VKLDDDEILSKNFKFRQIIESKVEEFKKEITNFHETVVLPDYERARSIFNFFAGLMTASPTWSTPTFSVNTDILNLLSGAVSGGVGVLPATSMITYCQTNSTSIYGQAITIYNYATALNF
jgi:hypothetical protein